MKFLVIAALLLPALSFAQISQPSSKRKPVTDVMHGVKITDPYRWLEDQNSPETRKWIAAQNKYSDALLKNQASRPYLKR